MNKITLREIRNSLESLITLGKKEGLEFELNFRLAKIAKELEPIVRVYEKTLQKYFEENGTYNEKTGQHAIDFSQKDKVTSFTEANNKLLDEQYDLEINTIPVQMFMGHDVTADTLRPILWMIEGEI